MEATLTSTETLPAEPTLSACAALYNGYSEEPKPLKEYAGVMATFSLVFAIFLGISRQTGRPLPERLSLGDILLVGVATFKLSRTISKEVVFSPLRAPFTQFLEKAGEGELNESPRGEGYQRTVGELLTCPFCLGMWVAAFFAYGLVLAPPLTRLLATILVSKAISDGLHLAYTAACKSID